MKIERNVQALKGRAALRRTHEGESETWRIWSVWLKNRGDF
jgi:hypothetical protein